MRPVNELAIAAVLVVAIAALVVVTIQAGANSVPSTGLRDLVILLGGALAGVSLPNRNGGA